MTAHLVVGPAEHGVTRCALELHATPALRDAPLLRVDDAVGADLPALVAGRPVHVHVTDRLFGRDALEAGAALAALGATAALTVTLHDVPQPSDGEGAFARRARGYAAVVAAARGVVVSSEHESALLDDALRLAGREDLLGRERAVVPLPVEPPARPVVPEPPATPRDLVVLGYLYPGKGHEEALEALPGLPDDVGLLALGRPSPGHEDLVDEIASQAAALGRRATVSGYVPDAELPARLRAAAVPVAPHRHLSASGSINSWLGAGRRPLVPRGRYVEELEARCPGALVIYDDLPSAAARALAEPALTWLAPQVRLTPTRDEAGAAYAELIGRWHR